MINKGKKTNNKSYNKKRGSKKQEIKYYDPKLIEAMNEELSPIVGPYGDKQDDGAVQMSFTLQVNAGEEAKAAAKMLVEKMGFIDVAVINMESMGPGFTYFVVYAKSEVTVDVSKIDIPKLDYPQYSFNDINKMLKEKLGRKSVVLGACIGSDAHTVGIDAIFNMKGYLGDYGLERYAVFDAINLRAQVAIDDLVKHVVERQADAVLISRVVTQRDEHLDELANFIAALNKAEKVPDKLIKICGGPRITHQEAIKLGYDAGFGPGTMPGHVASYLATELIKRHC